jgi:hypothetical protein
VRPSRDRLPGPAVEPGPYRLFHQARRPRERAGAFSWVGQTEAPTSRRSPQASSYLLDVARANLAARYSGAGPLDHDVALAILEPSSGVVYDLSGGPDAGSLT